MWQTEYTVQTTVEPEAIWRCWMDVEAWFRWDESIQRIQGTLAMGQHLRLKRRRWGLQKLHIVAFQEGQSFTCQQHRLFSKLLIHHHCEASELGSKITQRMEASGLLGWWLHLTLVQSMRASLPRAMRNLARMAAGL
jgi:hypothetical protein